MSQSLATAARRGGAIAWKVAKAAPAIALLGLYWYWINQRVISDGDQVFGLAGFFLLMCTATAYFPLPANLLVLGAVKTFDPFLVAFVAAVATVVAYLSEYLFFTLIFKSKKMASFKNSWLYQKVAPLFNRHRFFILAFASFLPIPSEALRVYAITRGYNKLAFASAGFLGRLPRYFLLGYFGRAYVHSIWFLVAVFLFPGVFLLLIRASMAVAEYVKALYVEGRPKGLPLSAPLRVSIPGFARRSDADPTTE